MSGRLAIRGHEAARRTVERWTAAEGAPHAVLLSGPPNVGKTTLAEDLAAGLLCLADDPSERPCRRCLACRKVAHWSHPDVHRLSPEGPGAQIRIAAVRSLSSELSLLPVEGRRRLAIVSAAQRLNEDAQGALLKTLEEPPDGVTIVLCVDDEEPLLPTVLSRCVRLPLPALAPGAIAEFLVERGAADLPRAARIARLAAGRPGVALAIARQPDLELALGRVARRLLDLSASDRRTRLSAASELISEGALLVELEGGGAVSRDDLEPAAEAPPAVPPPSAEAASPATRPAPGAVPPALRRRSVGALLAVWQAVARDLAVVARGGRSRVRWIGLLDELERTARGLPRNAAARFLERLERVSALVDANANPELAVDVLLLSWPRPAA